MFKLWGKDPAAKLEAEYRKLLEQARDLQRKGDIQGYGDMTARAEELAKKIDALKQEGK